MFANIHLLPQKKKKKSLKSTLTHGNFLDLVFPRLERLKLANWKCCALVCVCMHLMICNVGVCVGLWEGGGFPLMEKQHRIWRSEYLELPCQTYGVHIYYVIHSNFKRPVTQNSVCTSQTVF